VSLHLQVRSSALLRPVFHRTISSYTATPLQGVLASLPALASTSGELPRSHQADHRCCGRHAVYPLCAFKGMPLSSALGTAVGAALCVLMEPLCRVFAEVTEEFSLSFSILFFSLLSLPLLLSFSLLLHSLLSISLLALLCYLCLSLTCPFLTLLFSFALSSLSRSLAVSR
jgi:hypothetical protein